MTAIPEWLGPMYLQSRAMVEKAGDQPQWLSAVPLALVQGDTRSSGNTESLHMGPGESGAAGARRRGRRAHRTIVTSRVSPQGVTFPHNFHQPT